MKQQLSQTTLKQVHHDLTTRARGGIYIYMVIWLMLAYWAGIMQNSPLIFWLNTFLFAINLLLRVIHYWLHKHKPYLDDEIMYRWLISMVLFSALHWGILSAWLILISPYEQLYYMIMIVMAAFAMGGTATLSIATSIRKIYPLIIYLPSILLMFLLGDDTSETILLSFMAILSIIYILSASDASSRDYYSALTNRILAEQSAAKLYTLSITDSLTQLKNRMYFNQCFMEEWKRCARSNLPLSIMMIDLDHFKKINDQYGHSCGDLCLQSVAQILTDQFPRKTDTVARFGGEEFVVLLPDTNLKNAQNIATKLIYKFSQTKMNCQREEFSITCSIGIACTVPKHQINSEKLLMAADKAMYSAKEYGRNQWRVANLEMPE